jgi:hypothetical protein
MMDSSVVLHTTAHVLWTEIFIILFTRAADHLHDQLANLAAMPRYIHPITLRSKMAELLGDPSCVRWWLPNDEGFTPVLQSTRNFADERNAVAVSAQMENLREVKHIFTKLQLNDSDPGDLSGASKGKAPAR